MRKKKLVKCRAILLINSRPSPNLYCYIPTMGKSKHLQKTDEAVRTVRKFYLPLFLVIEALSFSILLGPFRSLRISSNNPISYGTLIFIILNVILSYYLYNSIKDGAIKDASKSVKRTKDGVMEVSHNTEP